MPIKTNLTDLTPSANRFKQDITLPSGGFSNPTAFPAGKLTVYPWDMNTSEWMATATKTNELSFMTQLVARLTHLPVDTVKTMVSSELPLVTMVSRALTFADNRVQFVAVCPHCSTVQPKVSIQIPNALEKVGVKEANYQHDEVILPVSKDVVTTRPVTVSEEEAARGRSERFQKVLGNAEATALAAVRTIGGGTPDSQDELIRWYKALSPADTESLLAEISKLNPGVDSDVKIQCEHTTCGRVFTYSLNLATDFFRH